MVIIKVYPNILFITLEPNLRFDKNIRDLFKIIRMDRKKTYNEQGDEVIKMESVLEGYHCHFIGKHTYITHRHALDDIIDILTIDKIEFKVVEVTHDLKPIVGEEIIGKYKMKDWFQLRDDQPKFINDILPIIPTGGKRLLNAKTGVGKTAMSFFFSSKADGNTMTLFSAKYMSQWLESFKDLTTLTDKDIILIQGTDNLFNYVDSVSKSYANRKKVVIASLETMSSYITNKYIVDGRLKEIDNSPKHPVNLLHHLDIKNVIIDEAHQKTKALSNVILALNPFRIIGLSATYYNANASVNRILNKYVFPKEVVVKYGDDENYINLVKFGYDINTMYMEGFRGYNAKDYMSSVLRSKYGKSYLNWLRLSLDLYFTDRQDRNKTKALIFLPTIDSILAMHKVLDSFSNDKENYIQQMESYISTNYQTFKESMIKREVKKIADTRKIRIFVKGLLKRIKQGYITKEDIFDGAFKMPFLSTPNSKYVKAYIVDNVKPNSITMTGLIRLIRNGITQLVEKRVIRYLDKIENDNVLISVMSNYIVPFQFTYVANYKGLKVKQFHGVHSLQDVLDADIIISTEGKCGAGMDIPKLQTVICGVNVSSQIDNIQMPGRLRKLDNVEQFYVYTWNAYESKLVRQKNNVFYFIKDKLKSDLEYVMKPKEKINGLYPLVECKIITERKLVNGKWVVLQDTNTLNILMDKMMFTNVRHHDVK